jgi:hypothetical protein
MAITADSPGGLTVFDEDQIAKNTTADSVLVTQAIDAEWTMPLIMSIVVVFMLLLAYSGFGRLIQSAISKNSRVALEREQKFSKQGRKPFSARGRGRRTRPPARQNGF